jgi:NAD(P)H-quinone oxidoreductase subunit 5
MNHPLLLPLLALTAPALMALVALSTSRADDETPGVLWRRFSLGAGLGLLASVLALLPAWGDAGASDAATGWLALGPTVAVLALLVQFLGTVIGRYSARYLEGERGQHRFVAALAGVLAAVQVLLIADHWLLLIAAWFVIGALLERLLCFHAERPFARLAAHKKRLVDRAADALLLLSAGLAWQATGAMSFSGIAAHLERESASPLLQAAAVALALAVVLRTALLPVHGWLIQVMEAPTPVSALLHAGVVNLGAVVLVRAAPWLEQAPLAQGLLVLLGALSAVLAGLVMLTRISIKVRLAWSTVAQMGFMLMQCGLGLYTLALLHLIGHSLYKAHAFLSASEVVRHTRARDLRGDAPVGALPAWVVWVAPVACAGVMAAIDALSGGLPWPWWWSLSLAFAWAPLLWPAARAGGLDRLAVGRGLGITAGVTVAALALHALPTGLHDAPVQALAAVPLLAMGGLYVAVARVRRDPAALAAWHRWCFAGFHLDEPLTRLTLKLWPHAVHAPTAGPAR